MPNSIADNLVRLQNAKTAIGNAITAKGGTVSAGDGLEEFAAAIATIPTGSDDSGHFIKETLPITFNGDGNNLSDYTIYGKQGGLNGVCPNTYPPIDDNSVNRGYWGMNVDGGLYGEPCYNKYNAWGGVCNAIYLEPGTYTFSVYIKTDLATNGIRIYVKGNSNYSPNYLPWAEGVGNGIVCTTGTSYQRFSHTFKVTAAGYVYPRVEKSEDDGNNVFVTCFQLEKGSTASPYVAYNTPGITINVNGSNIFFPRSTPLGPDDTLTMADTGVDITTLNGPNVISTPIVGGFDMKIKGGISSIPTNPINYVTRDVNFTNNTKSITEGSISSVSTFRQMTRCNVADDGTINAYYGDANYTEDGSNGQVMVYVPKFYYKLDVSASEDLDGVNIRHGKWSIADGPKAGYKLHPAFLAADGVTELPYFLYGAFEAVGQDSNGTYDTSYDTTSYKLSSVGGNTYKPTSAITRSTARTMATNRGTGWYSTGIKQTMAVLMLFIVEHGFNSQLTIGNGITSDSAAHNTGQLTGSSTYGTRDNSTTAVNYRGIENLWGNIWTWMDGFNCNSGTPYVCDTFAFVDDTATGYTQIGFNLPESNYITAFGYDANNDWILLPSESSDTASADGPIGDRVGTGSGWRASRSGGAWSSNDYAGAFYFYCNDDSSAVAGVSIGARIMYIPQV